MENTNLNEVAEELVKEVVDNEDIAVTVVKTSNKSKVVLAVAVTGLVIGAAVGVTKLMRRRKASNADVTTIDTKEILDGDFEETIIEE